MNMEKGIIIFSIDDGRRDMYRLVKEILIPENVPATLNITTNQEWFKFKELTYLETDELVEIAQSPLMEIANHADMHSNDYEDIQKGFLKLCDLLGYDQTKPIGFASPYSKMSVQHAKENMKSLNKIGIKYVRTCDRTSGRDHFNRDGDALVLTGFAPKHDTPLEELKEKADQAAENKWCLIYIIHSVMKPGEYKYDDDCSYDYDKFKEFVAYIKKLQAENKVDIMTTMEYVDMQLSK